MNAEPNTLRCDNRQLESYLNGELPEHTIQSVEDHLAVCANCRADLQAIAGQAEEWEQTRSRLSPDEFDRDPIMLAQTRRPGNREASMLSREICGWLDPTDDPKSLGRFAGYEIVGIVGHGGMGIVLKGFEASLNRFVAIKVLAPRLATNATARKRFAREAQAAAAVLHENVIAIHRVDEWNDLPFLVMPYVGGVSLQKRIDMEGPLRIEAALRVGVQIAAGLAAAHEQGLVHRDIKPANILLDQGVERVTITDFGLARAADDASMTRTGIIAGTPQYMSPEQAEAKAVDARSDLFSLGSVLYAMATGRPPFRGDGSFEVLKRIEREPARSLCEIDAAIPVWFENLVARLHSKAADDRPHTAHEVQRLLNACLLHLTQPTHALPSELLEVTVTKRHRGWWLAAGIGCAIAAVCWFVFFMQLPAENRDDSDEATAQATGDSDTSKGKQIATVLDKAIYEGDLNKNVSADDNLLRLIFQPLMEDYCQKNGLVPEEKLAKIRDKKSRQMARYFVLLAEFQRHLYEKHGGRVVLSAFGPMALDGTKKWLEERERAGEFEITDPRLKAKLAELWNKDAGVSTTSPSQIKAAFDPAATDRLIEGFGGSPAGAYSDPKMKLIGIVLGRPIHLHERHLDNYAELTEMLHGLIVGPLEEHYREQHPEVEPTAAEIDALAALGQRNDAQRKTAYRKRLAELATKLKDVEANSDEFLELQSQQQVIERKLKSGGGRPLAAFLARPMKFQKHLYDNYDGGRAIRTPQGALAFDAQKIWVQERERLGEFQVADPQLRDKLYDFWKDAKQRFGVNLINEPDQLKATFELPWIASDENAGHLPRRKVGSKVVVTQEERVERSPASIRFPTKQVAEIIERLKKKDDVETAVTELRRITSLDFGDGVDRESRRAWLDWWSRERGNVGKAADGVRNFIVVGALTDSDDRPLPGATVQVHVPFKASPNGRYLLAQTLSDKHGRYVLAFGAFKSAPEGAADVDATFSAMKPPKYELRPDDASRTRVLSRGDTVAEDREKGASLHPGKPAQMNFTLHAKQE
jgi:serine/threonine-protein kinase